MPKHIDYASPNVKQPPSVARSFLKAALILLGIILVYAIAVVATVLFLVKWQR
jgi:hypothetical protein